MSLRKISQLCVCPPSDQHICDLILHQTSASEALETFRWASKLCNFTHNQSTYRALIQKLCVFHRFDHVHQVLAEIPNSLGSPPHQDIFVTFVRGLGRAKRIRQLINVIPLVHSFGVTPSLKIHNSILDVLVKEDIDIARAFFRNNYKYKNKMMDSASGVQPDHYTFGTLMKGLCLTNRIGDAFKLLQLIHTQGFTPNTTTVIYNTLLHALCNNGKLGRARSLFAHILQPNDVTFNLLISAYCKQLNVVQALVLFEKSLSSGNLIDVITTTKLIDLLCNAGRPNEAAHVLQRLQRNGGVVDVMAYNTLIKGFCNHAKPKLALHFKKDMEIKGLLPNLHTYNILISGFCDLTLFHVALDLFNDMKTAAIQWRNYLIMVTHHSKIPGSATAAITYNFVTFDTLIKGLCSKGDVETGFKILEIMEDSKGGSLGNISPYNSIIYGLYRLNRWNEAIDFLNKMEKLFPRAVTNTLRIISLCEEGNLESAKELYHQMLHEGGIPNALVYSTLIWGLCQHKHVRGAFQLMNEMIGHGYSPVTATYNVVINGFCSQGKTVSALKLIEEMDERGCLVNERSYNPLILAHCYKGEFVKAFKILHQMVDSGIMPDYLIWNTLLYHLLDVKDISFVNNRIQWILET